MAHLTKSMGCAAGIMLTASHNPASDNGLKIFGADGYKLSDKLEAEIERLILNGVPEEEASLCQDIGKAISQSQQLLMDDKRTSHPFYWSAFAIIGDATRPLLSGAGPDRSLDIAMANTAGSAE